MSAAAVVLLWALASVPVALLLAAAIRRTTGELTEDVERYLRAAGGARRSGRDVVLLGITVLAVSALLIGAVIAVPDPATARRVAAPRPRAIPRVAPVEAPAVVATPAQPAAQDATAPPRAGEAAVVALRSAPVEVTAPAARSAASQRGKSPRDGSPRAAHASSGQGPLALPVRAARVRVGKDDRGRDARVARPGHPVF